MTRDRDAMLAEASEKLREAADLVDEAMHMSGIRIAADTSARIRALADSPDDAGSIENLRRAAEHAGDDPVWTRPLDSVKHSPQP